MNATTYAVDTAKNVMQLHWVDADTGEVCRRKLSRAKFFEFFAQRHGCHIVLEACAGSHHLARRFSAMGHFPQLLPTRPVRAFVEAPSTGSLGPMSEKATTTGPSISTRTSFTSVPTCMLRRPTGTVAASTCGTA